jgi:hypothetical protein
MARSTGSNSNGSKNSSLCCDQGCIFPTGICQPSPRCEATSEERSAGNPHATFCGSRGWATASGHPVVMGDHDSYSDFCHSSSVNCSPSHLPSVFETSCSALHLVLHETLLKVFRIVRYEPYCLQMTPMRSLCPPVFSTISVVRGGMKMSECASGLFACGF